MSYTNGLDKPTDYFNTKLYTGNGYPASNSNNITGVGFQPDLVWLKVRSNADNHCWFDSVRGVQKRLASNLSAVESNRSTALTSFDSDGFTLGVNSESNTENYTYASWNWKKTATAGFDIVAYTGNATVRTISHSLSAVPKMIIVKNRSNVHDWRVYHASLGATHDIYLSSDGAKVDSTTPWNDTEPTSSVFTVGTANGTNQNGDSLIAYLFAEKQGYSKFGSYTGNGNADGTFIYTGFKPAFFLWKQSSASGQQWYMQDNKRNLFNPSNNFLQPSNSDAEYTGSSYPVDFLSNGIKIRNTSAHINASGATYIYMTFASNPFVTSSGVPATAR